MWVVLSIEARLEEAFKEGKIHSWRKVVDGNKIEYLVLPKLDIEQIDINVIITKDGCVLTNKEPQ